MRNIAGHSCYCVYCDLPGQGRAGPVALDNVRCVPRISLRRYMCACVCMASLDGGGGHVLGVLLAPPARKDGLLCDLYVYFVQNNHPMEHLLPNFPLLKGRYCPIVRYGLPARYLAVFKAVFLIYCSLVLRPRGACSSL